MGPRFRAGVSGESSHMTLGQSGNRFVWPARSIGTRVDRQQAIDAEPRSIITRFSGIRALLS